LLGQYEKRQIIVPQFQRGYSWESTHVSAFWRDLLEFQNQTYTRLVRKKWRTFRNRCTYPRLSPDSTEFFPDQRRGILQTLDPFFVLRS